MPTAGCHTTHLHYLDILSNSLRFCEDVRSAPGLVGDKLWHGVVVHMLS